MAIDPAERFHSASAMADALDDELADRAGGVVPPRPAWGRRGRLAAGTAVARANPPIPYAADAYAGGPRRHRHLRLHRPAVTAEAPDEGAGGPGPGPGSPACSVSASWSPSASWRSVC